MGGGRRKEGEGEGGRGGGRDNIVDPVKTQEINSISKSHENMNLILFIWYQFETAFP